MPESLASTETRPEPTVGAGLTIDELPVQARLRLEHAGRWVAWAEDDQSILAVADTHDEVREAARRAGVARAVCEWVPPVPTRPLGR
jgi:uncharacterized protein with PhoU and TrkA domain